MSGTLFPGWRPDAAGRERLQAVVASLAAARPADGPGLQLRRPDQWHVTLCFLGYDLRHKVTPSLLEAFADVAARIPPHAFAIERLACWRQSGVIVALPRPCDALQALCEATHAAARRCGIPAEKPTGQPHVTLAYVPRGLEAQPWLDGVDCSGAPLRVAGFELLFNPGGRYEALGEWPLTGGALPQPPSQPSLL